MGNLIFHFFRVKNSVKIIANNNKLHIIHDLFAITEGILFLKNSITIKTMSPVVYKYFFNRNMVIYTILVEFVFADSLSEEKETMWVQED